jgi:hypothetical protein
MNRPVALAVCLCVAGWAVAQPPVPPDSPRVLTVEPAAAPVPALKYQLLPELAELNPGNAVPEYLKCFCEQNNFFFNKEQADERLRLLKVPLAEIRPGSLKNYGGPALKQADHAARLEYADWNTLPRMREQGFFLLIPEVQQIRLLAYALAVRGRGQIVDQDYAGAVGTIKTILALGRHLGDHPTIISGLVGVAIARDGLNVLEELVQQPGAPNLYWALTALPNPLVETHRSLGAERMMQASGLGELSNPNRVWIADDVPAAIQKGKELIGMAEMPAEDRDAAGPWMAERVKDEAWLTAARKLLTDHGFPADKVAKYPPEQVLVFKLLLRARIVGDEAIKWMNVPYWQAEAGMVALVGKGAGIEERLERFFVFSVGTVKVAHTRLEQRIALLRVAEAIRLDAAKTGKLPAKLTDLSVPVSNDPASGQPFGYKVDGATAALTGKQIGAAAAASYGKYEVRLRQR